jgi:hypothetical protein
MLQDFIRSWKDDMREATKEIVAVADKLAPKA